MNILVTGGAGYVGSHVCKALAQAGYIPVTYDNLEHGHDWAVKWGPLEVGDILDRNRLNEVMQRYKPYAIMHFAAYTYVGESVRFPEKYIRNNIEGSKNLLEVTIENGIEKFIFSSSCVVYGNSEHSVITEDLPLNPVNLYGETKVAAEDLLSEYSSKNKFNYVVLRYFNAAGADPDIEIGEAHDPETHLIPIVLNTALGHQKEIKIYGDNYDTPDGSCIRDYIHVCDLADAHIKAIQYLENTNQSVRINLGTGIGYSVKEIIASARRITGKEIKEKIVAKRRGDMPSLVSNNDYARKILDWIPQQSQIDNILDTAWKWHCKR